MPDGTPTIFTLKKVTRTIDEEGDRKPVDMSQLIAQNYDKDDNFSGDTCDEEHINIEAEGDISDPVLEDEGSAAPITDNDDGDNKIVDSTAQPNPIDQLLPDLDLDILPHQQS